ncbi:hypothetical protein RNAN_2355 [Rheinheimera nanhaiensis E407-8]|uniref:Secreted protein n=2 Tax=Rheinheimera TaxID=67575 RepID=I1DZ75_9GAMM|nr:hypothetical protein RNAN_2355 [Rheinheimera nanhaiensis E407-8]
MILHYCKPFCMALMLPARLTCLLFLLAAPLSSVKAAPGAHGPNGEHLTTDTTAQTTLLPRFETFSEQFELVGELQSQQLVLHLHQYQTNAAVMHAEIELETANLSSKARFIAQQQHYLLQDTALLEQLQQQGRHEIIITVITDDAADLLTASLEHKDADDEHGDTAHHQQHGHFPWWTLALLPAFAGGMLFQHKRAGQ